MIHTPALHDVGTDVFVVDENDDYYAATVIGVTAGVHRWVRGIYGDELVPLSSLRDYTWAGLA